MLTRSLADMDRLITANLHRIRALPFDVVVHLPRSGTIPASLIATYLSVPFASVDEFCGGIVHTRKSNYAGLNRVLLVDDSIRTGVQMEGAVDRLRNARPDADILTLAVFSTEHPRTHQPTLVLESHAETKYIYPWFMWKSKRIADCAADMDGVLCRDCTRAEDDDGAAYAAFLASADPKFHTVHRIGAIVTSRLEKYRPQTEAWLARQGILYSRLIMGPWASPDDRRGHAADWKGEVYRTLPQSLYIESSERDAAIIARVSRRPVWSVETQRRHG